MGTSTDWSVIVFTEYCLTQQLQGKSYIFKIHSFWNNKDKATFLQICKFQPFPNQL